MGATRRRRSVVVALVIVVTALASAGAAWWFSSQVWSPADIAAESKPPAPSIITHPIDRREIHATFVTRGTVARGNTYEIELLANPAPDGALPMVTWIAPLGTSIAEGDIVVVVAGRPVIALEGSLPLYRNLASGDIGDDVRQLEGALQRLGLFDGTPDTRFDWTTERAVRQLYRSVGHTHPEQVLVAELLFLPELPKTVVDQSAELGRLLAGPVLSLSSEQLHVLLDLPAEVASRLTVGQLVEVDDAVSGVSTWGQIESIEFGHDVSVGFASVRVSLESDVDALAGVSVRVRLTTEASEGLVLVVPAVAVVTTSTGETRVEVVGTDGSVRSAAVEVGVSADGFVEIRSVDGDLMEGDLVSVGTGFGS